MKIQLRIDLLTLGTIRLIIHHLCQINRNMADRDKDNIHLTLHFDSKVEAGIRPVLLVALVARSIMVQKEAMEVGGDIHLGCE